MRETDQDVNTVCLAIHRHHQAFTWASPAAVVAETLKATCRPASLPTEQNQQTLPETVMSDHAILRPAGSVTDPSRCLNRRRCSRPPAADLHVSALRLRLSNVRK